MNSAAVRQVLANRNVTATLTAFLAFTLVMQGAWLVAIVFAFDQGGAGEAGIVALAVLGPAAVLGPFVAVWFDRMRPGLALATSLGTQTITLGLTAVAVAAEVDRVAVYALLTLFNVAQMSTRPTVSVVLPRVVRNPVELSAANSMVGVMETMGLMVGPALAGVVLAATDDVAAAFAAAAACLVIGSLSALTIRVDGTDGAELDDPDPDSVWTKVTEGWALLRTEPASRDLVVIMAMVRLTVGVLEVGVVVVAVDHLGRTEATAGLLGAAIGFGAVIGSALTFLLIGRRRMSGPIVLGTLCACIPIAAMAGTRSQAVTLALLAVAGLGRPLVDVGSRTLLQGLSTDDMLARIFGLQEGITLLVLVGGSLSFSWLTLAFDVRTALVVTGLAPAVVVIALAARLKRVDEARPEADPALVALLRSVPIFAPLAAFRIEQMLLNLGRTSVSPGGLLFAEGDEGTEIFLIDEGSAVVGLGAGPVELKRGDVVGEIALLRDQPRMATVRAGTDGLAAYTLDRDVFLDAIATAPTSLRRTERTVERRLADGGTEAD